MLRDHHAGRVSDDELRRAGRGLDVRVRGGGCQRSRRHSRPERRSEHIICWAGDGGTYDIGIATLSAAAERNEDILYICYDNEIYGNTGGQRSSATPHFAHTTTSPRGKAEDKKDILSIMAAHGIPYAATLSVAHPEDFRRKVRTALDLRGTRFLLMHSPCPTGWKSESGDSIELVRLAVSSGLFLVYEIEDGKRYRINVRADVERSARILSPAGPVPRRRNRLRRPSATSVVSASIACQRWPSDFPIDV